LAEADFKHPPTGQVEPVQTARDMRFIAIPEGIVAVEERCKISRVVGDLTGAAEIAFPETFDFDFVHPRIV
jgi:hypothetical protein